MSALLPSALRTRFRKYIEEELSGRAAAARLRVSPATGARWARQIRTKGHADPAVQGRPPGSGKLAPHRAFVVELVAQLETLADEIGRIGHQLMAWHRQSAASQRLETIPGVGIITATALAASVPDPSVFKSGRQFRAWLGLVRRQNSSDGKDRLGSVRRNRLERVMAVS